MKLKRLNVFTGLNGVGKTKLIDELRASATSQTLYFDKPENNLHPSLQSKWIKDLCAKTEKSNDIVFIETHSDHIINAILVSCKKFMIDGVGINPDYVNIVYLEDDRTHTIPISEVCRIKNAPRGFFDQINIDQRYLLGYTK
jgi:predicted ATPase